MPTAIAHIKDWVPRNGFSTFSEPRPHPLVPKQASPRTARPLLPAPFHTYGSWTFVERLINTNRVRPLTLRCGFRVQARHRSTCGLHQLTSRVEHVSTFLPVRNLHRALKNRLKLSRALAYKHTLTHTHIYILVHHLDSQKDEKVHSTRKQSRKARIQGTVRASRRLPGGRHHNSTRQKCTTASEVA